LQSQRAADPVEISFRDVIRLIVQLIADRFGQETANHPQLKQASFTEQINSAKVLGLGRATGRSPDTLLFHSNLEALRNQKSF
jgi:hypothetical protein